MLKATLSRDRQPVMLSTRVAVLHLREEDFRSSPTEVCYTLAVLVRAGIKSNTEPPADAESLHDKFNFFSCWSLFGDWMALTN